MKWNIEAMLEAGIDPSLMNYLAFTEEGCVSCPLHMTCSPLKQEFRKLDETSLVIWRCPVFLVELKNLICKMEKK